MHDPYNVDRPRTVRPRARRAMLVAPPGFTREERNSPLLPATRRAKRCVRERRFLESGTTRFGIRGMIFVLKET